MVPGQETEITLKLDHIAYRVPAGHQVRVAMSNAYWPLVWPAPQSGTLTLRAGTLTLPVAPTPDSQWTFPPPDAADPWDTEEIRPEHHVRRQETDMVTGVVSLIIEDDFGKLRDSDHGLINGSIARERWSIHPDDPLSAKGSCHWTDELERDDIRLRTEARCEMWADAGKFYLSATLQAFENDTQVFETAIQDEIPRDHL